MNFGMNINHPANFYTDLNKTGQEWQIENSNQLQSLGAAQQAAQAAQASDRNAAIDNNFFRTDPSIPADQIINQAVFRQASGQPSFGAENRANWQQGMLPNYSPQMSDFNSTWGNEIAGGPGSSGTWIDSQNKAFGDFMQNRQQDITRQQQAYQQQQGGSAAGGIVPQNYSTPFAGQITGQPNQQGSPSPWDSPGFGGPNGSAPVDQYNRPGGLGGLGGFGGSSFGVKGEWGGPFARNNPFASS